MAAPDSQPPTPGWQGREHGKASRAGEQGGERAPAPPGGLAPGMPDQALGTRVGASLPPWVPNWENLPPSFSGSNPAWPPPASTFHPLFLSLSTSLPRSVHSLLPSPTKSSFRFLTTQICWEGVGASPSPSSLGAGSPRPTP